MIFALRPDLEELAGRVAEAARGLRAAPPRATPMPPSETKAASAAAPAESESAPGAEALPGETAAAAGASRVTAEGAGLVEVIAGPPRGGKGRRAAALAAAGAQLVPAQPGGASLEDACQRAVRPLVEKYGVESVALMLRSGLNSTS